MQDVPVFCMPMLVTAGDTAYVDLVYSFFYAYNGNIFLCGTVLYNAHVWLQAHTDPSQAGEVRPQLLRCAPRCSLSTSSTSRNLWCGST